MYATKDWQKFNQGVNNAVALVRSTQGGCGKNVVFVNGKDINVTNDGVTVLQAYQVPDLEENEGIRHVISASRATVNQAGDGTTGTAVLFGGLLEQAELADFRKKDGRWRREYLAGMRDASTRLLSFLKDNAKELPEGEVERLLVSVATVAAHGDKSFGKPIGELVAKLGKDGDVSAEMSRSGAFETERVDGFKIGMGYVSDALAGEKRAMDIEDCLVAVVNYTLDKAEATLGHIVTKWKAECGNPSDPQRFPTKPLVIIAPAYLGESAATLSRPIDNMGRPMSLYALRMPVDVPGLLEDVEAYTGAVMADGVRGRVISKPGDWQFGTAKRMKASRTTSFLLGGGGAEAGTLAAHEAELVRLESEGMEGLKPRLRALRNSLGIVRLASKTEGEFAYEAQIVEDCVRACFSALAEGVLPGAGKAMVWYNEHYLEEEISDWSEGYVAGVNCFVRASEGSYLSILANAGLTPNIGDEQNTDFWSVLNVVTQERGNAVEMGLLDSAKVVRCTIENAVAAADVLLNSEYLLVR